MPAVFVHGVPDTAQVWRPLLAELSRTDTVCLALPGFGSKRPDGFTPDKEGYVAWLTAELGKIEGPIDLVAHDWGSLLVTRVVSVAPGIVRSWCGGGAPLDPDYVWHSTAQIWQTPERGEAFMQAMTPALLAQTLVAQGIGENAARDTAALVDDEMKTCILSLYRSAVRVADEWFSDLTHARAPALILWGENDPYASPRFGERLASHVGGRFALLPATGHWYQVQEPAHVAHLLEDFWSDLVA
jgi:pimeloyl-ACP methyl ester carboxylesterase